MEKPELFSRPKTILINRLAELYRTDDFAVSKVCDEALDRSGNLLGEVRDRYFEIKDLYNYQDSRFKKYLEYITNTGGSPTIAMFDDDWEPIGPRVRADMEKQGLIQISNGLIKIK